MADGSLSAWLTFLARLCDIALAIMNFFKGADWMKKVLALVGKGVSGVPYAGPSAGSSYCINISIWHFTPIGVQFLYTPPSRRRFLRRLLLLC